MASVLRVTMDGEEQSVALKQGRNVIGNSAANMADILVVCTHMSCRHALITVGDTAAECTIEYLGSTNGSAVATPGDQMQWMDVGCVYPLPDGSALVCFLSPALSPGFPPGSSWLSLEDSRYHSRPPQSPLLQPPEYARVLPLLQMMGGLPDEGGVAATFAFSAPAGIDTANVEQVVFFIDWLPRVPTTGGRISFRTMARLDFKHPVPSALEGSAMGWTEPRSDSISHRNRIFGHHSYSLP